jgi:hypothetical protein
LFGENLVKSPGFHQAFGIHQVFTRFCTFTKLSPSFRNNQVFTIFMKNSPFLLPGFGNLLSFGNSPGFHQVFTRFWNFTKFNPNFSVKHINFTPKNGKTRPGEFRLTEGLPGIHQRFIAIGFPGNGAEETLLSKLPTITAVKP